MLDKIISEKINLLFLCSCTVFFAFPNNRSTISGSSSCFPIIALTLSENPFAIKVLNFPFKVVPGIIGRSLCLSRITGESTAPIAENAEDPPICIPVTTFIFPEIFILLYISSLPMFTHLYH